MKPPSLASLVDGYRALVFGSSGGIGDALVRALVADPRCGAVHAAARRGGDAVPGAMPLTFSLENEDSIAEAAALAAADGQLDLVIVATGLLHDDRMQPEKSWRAIDADAMERAFRVNTIGPALIAKYVLGRLAPGRKTAFVALSARVGSITDNRLGGWHAYRASKAALNQLVKTCAIELARRNPQAVCVTMHPGTVATALSQPFRSSVPDGGLFTPERSAARILAVIDGLSGADTGKLLAWDGSVIPF